MVLQLTVASPLAEALQEVSSPPEALQEAYLPAEAHQEADLPEVLQEVSRLAALPLRQVPEANRLVSGPWHLRRVLIRLPGCHRALPQRKRCEISHRLQSLRAFKLRSLLDSKGFRPRRHQRPGKA